MTTIILTPNKYRRIDIQDNNACEVDSNNKQDDNKKVAF